jgi:hypothetical protein
MARDVLEGEAMSTPLRRALATALAAVIPACAVATDGEEVTIDPAAEDALAGGERRIPQRGEAWVPAYPDDVATLGLAKISFGCDPEPAIPDAICARYRDADHPGRAGTAIFRERDGETTLYLYDRFDELTARHDFRYADGELTMSADDGTEVPMTLANRHQQVARALATSARPVTQIPGELTFYYANADNPARSSGAYRDGAFVEAYDWRCEVAFVQDGSPWDDRLLWALASCRAVFDGPGPGDPLGTLGHLEVASIDPAGRTKRLAIGTPTVVSGQWSVPVGQVSLTRREPFGPPPTF